MTPGPPASKASPLASAGACHRKPSLLLTPAFLAIIAGSLACAGHASQPQSPILLPTQLDLPRLVDLSAQRLGLNIEYDAAAIRGEVALRLGTALTDDELWVLTNRALAARGFTTVRQPGTNIVSVVSLAAAPAAVTIASSDSPMDPGFNALVLRLKHRAPREVTEAIARVLSKPGGAVGALGDPNAGGGLLLVSDLGPRLEEVRRLVELLDTPDEPPLVEELAVRNIPPLAMVALMTQVAAKREAVAGRKTPGEVLASAGGDGVLVIAPAARMEEWKSLIASLDRRERVETHAYAPRAFSPAEVATLIEQTARDLAPRDDRWRLVVDSLTGSLIITATPSQHEAIRDLVKRLDDTPSSERRHLRAIVIRNRSVGEVLPILKDLLHAGVLDGGGPIEPSDTPDLGAPRMPQEVRPAPGPAARVDRPGVGMTTPGAESGANSAAVPRAAPSTAAGGRDLTLTADEATNTLMAMGGSRALDQLEAIVRQIDIRQPQVMLEVLLISLTDAQALDVGVELERRNQDLGGDTTANLASLFGLVPRAGGVPVLSGPGFSGIVLDPGDFSVVLRALRTISDGRSLSMPRVLVGNSQRAILDSVLEQPFASTNASDTVSTTSFGGTLPAGTQIAVRPQIAQGDYLALEYQVSLSSFTGAAGNPSLPPPRQQNRVQSIATIPDGHTVVVGGIELNTVGESASQVPLLGDIPGIGHLFSNRSRDRSRTRFFVFIRPTILRARGFEDLKYVSELSARGLGVDDGFPEVEPRLIPSHSPFSDGCGPAAHERQP